MFTARQLAALSVAYSGATGKSLAALGDTLFRDHQFFKRLNGGMDCTTARAAEASRWFMENWPDDIPWPVGITPAIAPEQAAE
jgi:hypothetical protein